MYHAHHLIELKRHEMEVMIFGFDFRRIAANSFPYLIQSEKYGSTTGYVKVAIYKCESFWEYSRKEFKFHEHYR